jgi:hypothetical protein
MTKKVISELNEVERDNALYNIAKTLLPEYGNQWNVDSLVTLKRQTLSRLLYLNNLYQLIINVPGVICEFGVKWGATLTQLINLRGIYEPYNHSRRIFGFDTFEGHVVVDEKDGSSPKIGDFSTFTGYEITLDEILSLQESFNPLSHIKKSALIKGDSSITIEQWLEDNLHAIISMAIFDMDVYAPTKNVLSKIIPRLTKGSVLVFDELNCETYPGETQALFEVLGFNRLALRRFPHQPFCAWAVWE